jgi:PST family polysaccharide transporter
MKDPGRIPSPRSLARGLGWSSCEAAIRQALALSVFVMITREIGPADFGLVAAALIGPLCLQAMIIKGFPESLLQRPKISEDHLASVHWLLVGLGGAATILLFAGAGALERLLAIPGLEPVVQALSILVVLSAWSATPQVVLQRRMDFRPFALKSLSGGLLGAGAALLLLGLGYGLWSLVALYLVRGATETAVILGAAGWWPRRRFSSACLRDLWPNARAIALEALVSLGIEEMPKVSIALVLGEAVLGIYMLGRRIFDFLQELLLQPAFGVALAAFSRVQHDRRRRQQLLADLLVGTGLVAYPAFIGLAIIASDALPFAFGATWSASVPVAQAFMLLGIERSSSNLLCAALQANGHAGQLLKLSALHLFVLAVLMPLGLLGGPAAVALCQGVAGICMLPVLVWLAERMRFSVRHAFRSGILILLLAASTGGAAALVVRTAGIEPQWKILAVTIMTAAILYVATCALFARSMLRRTVFGLSSL